jgi:acetyl esterase/lipase
MSSTEIALLRELLDLNATMRGHTLAQRRQHYDRAEAAFAHADGPPGEVVRIAQCSAQWARAVRAEEPVVLYLHGGSYTMGSLGSHRHLVRELGAACQNAAVLAVDYRLAPEEPFPAAVVDAVACYQWLLAAGVAPSRVVFAGDSAGAGIAVASMLALRDKGVALPAAAVCISPWTDLTCCFDSHATRALRDPVLSTADLRAMAALYVADNDPRHPQVSPAFADLAGLPALLVQVGSEEILLDDARVLARNARAAGVPVVLEEWPDMIHVWHYYFPILTEGRAAIAAIGRFIGAVLGGGRPDLIDR